MKKNRMIWLKMSSFIVYDTVSEWCAPVFQHVHCTHANTHTNNTNNTQDIERKHWIDWNYVFFVVSRNAGEKRNRTTPSESEQKLPKTVSYTHICVHMIVNYVGIVCIMYKQCIVWYALKCFPDKVWHELTNALIRSK